MDQSLFTNMPEKIAELGYEQKQALLYGGAQEPYTFTLPDGSVHECGRGIRNLYQTMLALSGLEAPKAGEMAAMLETHKDNAENILKYVRQQVEQYAPEGGLRTDLLNIVNGADDPATRNEQFMAYMAALTAVVERQTYIVDSVQAMGVVDMGLNWLLKSRMTDTL